MKEHWKQHQHECKKFIPLRSVKGGAALLDPKRYPTPSHKISGLPLAIPSLHTICQEDEGVARRQSEMLTACFRKPRVVYHHEGHQVPQEGDAFLALLRFLYEHLPEDTYDTRHEEEARHKELTSGNGPYGTITSHQEASRDFEIGTDLHTPERPPLGTPEQAAAVEPSQKASTTPLVYQHGGIKDANSTTAAGYGREARARLMAAKAKGIKGMDAGPPPRGVYPTVLPPPAAGERGKPLKR